MAELEILEMHLYRIKDLSFPVTGNEYNITNMIPPFLLRNSLSNAKRSCKNYFLYVP